MAPYYGWGFQYYGYNYNYGTQTAYGNAASARADLIKAQGQASKSQAEASVANEQARQQYLENQEKYLQMRQEQKAVIEARKAKEREERQEQIKSRPQKKPTDLYPRLSIDQLDSTAGVIHWPDSLRGTDFDEERNQLDDAVRSIAEHGPSERLATSIKSTVDKMKTKTQPLMAEVGFEEYSEVRKFLGSLSVEGYYALEEL